MKKTFPLIIVLFAAYFSNAQDNNPYNKVGIDFASSLKIISEDFKAGKVKDFSNEAIESYARKLPLKAEVNMDLASKVFSTVKGKDFNFINTVKESAFSKTSKEFFIKAAVNPDKLDNKQMKAYLIDKTAEINKSQLADAEKQLVLSLISIIYNSNELSRDSYCTISGPEGSGPIDCGTAGTIIGGIIGWSICGPLCGLGGAIIGGVVGSLS